MADIALYTFIIINIGEIVPTDKELTISPAICTLGAEITVITSPMLLVPATRTSRLIPASLLAEMAGTAGEVNRLRRLLTTGTEIASGAVIVRGVTTPLLAVRAGGAAQTVTDVCVLLSVC